MEIKERLHKKLNQSTKSQKEIFESLTNVEDHLEITNYDKLESNEYVEILEHKFKRSINLFSVFIYSLKLLKSKKVLGNDLFHFLYSKFIR